MPFSFRDYAIEDYDYGVSYLRRALEIDPTNKSAAYVLGKLHYEMEEYRLMIALFNDFLKYYPNDKDINLFLGLAFLRQRQYEDAFGCFKIALNEMSDEERKLFLNPTHLMKDEGTLHDPDSLRLDFWKKKDPMFLTAENERLLEHYGRVAYCNMRFGVPRLGIEGWKTDRGKIYIRYGKPRVIVDYGKTMDEQNIYSPMQIWVYPQFQMAFTDQFWNGNYQFTEPSLGSISAFKERTDVNFTLVAENVFRELPDHFDFQLSGGSFKTSYRILFFRGKKATEAVLNFNIPLSEVLYEPKQKLLAGLFLLNDDRKTTFNLKKPILCDLSDQPRESLDSSLTSFLEFTHSMGKYNYSFELLNETLNKSFVKRSSLEIPNYHQDSLLISDLLLAKDFSLDEKENYYKRNGFSLMPNVEHVFSNTDTLFVYFEVYNLSPDRTGKTHYTVENAILSKDDGGLLGSLFGSDPQKVSVVNEYSANNRNDFVVQSMNINNLDPGEYELEIVIHDNQTKTSIKKRTNLTIIESLTD